MPASIHKATLRAFNAGTYLARVTLESSIHLSINDVPVSRGIAAAQMIAGRKVTVVLFDQTKATDAVITSVYT